MSFAIITKIINNFNDYIINRKQTKDKNYGSSYRASSNENQVQATGSNECDESGENLVQQELYSSKAENMPDKEIQSIVLNAPPLNIQTQDQVESSNILNGQPSHQMLHSYQVQSTGINGPPGNQDEQIIPFQNNRGMNGFPGLNAIDNHQVQSTGSNGAPANHQGQINPLQINRALNDPPGKNVMHNHQVLSAGLNDPPGNQQGKINPFQMNKASNDAPAQKIMHNHQVQSSGLNILPSSQQMEGIQIINGFPSKNQIQNLHVQTTNSLNGPLSQQQLHVQSKNLKCPESLQNNYVQLQNQISLNGPPSPKVRWIPHFHHK